MGKNLHQRSLQDYTSEWGCSVLMNSQDGLNIRVVSRGAMNNREEVKGNVATTASAIQYP
jgi:carbohydrate-binding DOMON domain-containing protein